MNQPRVSAQCFQALDGHGYNPVERPFPAGMYRCYPADVWRIKQQRHAIGCTDTDNYSGPQTNQGIGILKPIAGNHLRSQSSLCCIISRYILIVNHRDNTDITAMGLNRQNYVKACCGYVSHNPGFHSAPANLNSKSHISLEIKFLSLLRSLARDVSSGGVEQEGSSVGEEDVIAGMGHFGYPEDGCAGMVGAEVGRDTLVG